MPARGGVNISKVCANSGAKCGCGGAVIACTQFSPDNIMEAESLSAVGAL